MAKKTKSVTNRSFDTASKIILTTTFLLLAGLVIVFIGWVVEGSAGQLLIGFGGAFVFLSAIIYSTQLA